MLHKMKMSEFLFRGIKLILGDSDLPDGELVICIAQFIHKRA